MGLLREGGDPWVLLVQAGLLGNASRTRSKQGCPGSVSRSPEVCPGRCRPCTSGGAACWPSSPQGGALAQAPAASPPLSRGRKSPGRVSGTSARGTRGGRGLVPTVSSASGALVTRGARSLPAAKPRTSGVFCLLPRSPSFPFPALVVAGIMNKKKKPFLGMPAPLGYVPGLGRG